ncbi:MULTISPECIES: hypothetical protein [unclassified Bradyrhizobium]|uniref:hypothetical protein n=1 Tax=unclassified Bradyrhizobium TaxID=2631580 RepID=UPI0024E10354|nr:MULTISPECIES: hypothetical protein [unclassified Bradyrhizobium]
MLNSAGEGVAVFAWAADGHDEQRKPFKLVSDVLSHPKLSKGYHMEWSHCRLDGAADDAVVAVVRDAKRTWLRASAWAYRLESSSGKFVKLEPKRVDCYNPAIDAAD